MNTPTSILLIVLLLAANGFFVAAEFALVKARRFRIESLAKDGSSSASLVLDIQLNLEAYLAACQLGITMASLGLGWVGEPAVSHLLAPLLQSFGFSDAMVHSLAFIIGFLIFSSLHIVIGEQVPKTLAIRKPEPVSVWIAYPLHWTYLSVYPLNWLLNRASGYLLSLLNVSPVSHSDVFSGEELKGLVAESSEHGEIHEDHAAMLHNLFEFDQRQISRVMVPRSSVHCLELHGDPDANLAVIRDKSHSRFPVIDNSSTETLAGILLTNDIHRAMLAGEVEPWRDLKRFCREALVVPESQRVPKLFELMRQRRVHLAIVIDEYGAFTGIVTLEDLLEEIVGEILDETDQDDFNSMIEEIDEHTWKSDGLISLSDLEKNLGLVVSDSIDANTLSGLIMEELASMPTVGDQVLSSGFRFTVMSIIENRVGIVTLERVIEPSANQQAANDEN